MTRRTLIAELIATVAAFRAPIALAGESDVQWIDDRRGLDATTSLGTSWVQFTDDVMGGVSTGRLSFTTIEGRRCLHLTGEVRLENNGGFVQAAAPLVRGGRALDASSFAGVRLVVRGNGEEYAVHLRTPDTWKPWQYYTASFSAGEEWSEVWIPFQRFTPVSLTRELDTSHLTRLGLVAIGRAFHADLAVSEVSLYR